MQIQRVEKHTHIVRFRIPRNTRQSNWLSCALHMIVQLPDGVFLLNMNFAMQVRRMGLAASFTRNQMLISVCETQKHIPNTYICLEAIQSYLFVSSCMLLNVRLVVCAHRWLQNGIYIYDIILVYMSINMCVYTYMCPCLFLRLGLCSCPNICFGRSLCFKQTIKFSLCVNFKHQFSLTSCVCVFALLRYTIVKIIYGTKHNLRDIFQIDNSLCGSLVLAYFCFQLN